MDFLGLLFPVPAASAADATALEVVAAATAVDAEAPGALLPVVVPGALLAAILLPLLLEGEAAIDEAIFVFLGFL